MTEATKQDLKTVAIILLAVFLVRGAWTFYQNHNVNHYRTICYSQARIDTQLDNQVDLARCTIRYQ